MTPLFTSMNFADSLILFPLLDLVIVFKGFNIKVTHTHSPPKEKKKKDLQVNKILSQISVIIKTFSGCTIIKRENYI